MALGRWHRGRAPEFMFLLSKCSNFLLCVGDTACPQNCSKGPLAAEDKRRRSCLLGPGVQWSDQGSALVHVAGLRSRW